MTDRANARDSSCEGLLWAYLDEPRYARVSPRAAHVTRAPSVGEEVDMAACSAQHLGEVAAGLREVLAAIDAGETEATEVQRAYLAGAMEVLGALAAKGT